MCSTRRQARSASPQLGNLSGQAWLIGQLLKPDGRPSIPCGSVARASCFASAYLRSRGTGKSPLQLLGHCASMMSASRFGNNSAGSMASAETDDPTVTQITDAIRMSTMTSFARRLQGNRRGAESGRSSNPAPNAMHIQTTGARAPGRVRIANRTGKQFTRPEPDKRFREPTLTGTRIKPFKGSVRKKTPGAGHRVLLRTADHRGFKPCRAYRSRPRAWS